MSVADMAITQAGQSVVFEAIKNLLEVFEPSKAHLMLPKFRWRAIATTNYDELIEKAYFACSEPLQNIVPLVKNSEPVEERLQSATSPVLLLKLHGCIRHAHDESIPLVLSHEHYALHAHHRDNLFERLKAWAHESTFIFCGYRLGDAHIRSILHRLDAEGIKRPTYYIVTPNMHDQEVAYWSSKNVQVLKATFDTFMASLDSVVPEMWRRLDPGTNLKPHPVTVHFRSNADPSPALLRALDNDFVYVHSAMAFERQDPKLFYQGYDTGWGAVIQGLDTIRTIVSDLLLEVVTDENSLEASLFLLRGPAGSGKTVSLKRAAWDAACTLGQLVLWLGDSGALRAEALVELYDLTGKRLIVFVDRAAERLPQIEHILSVGREKKIPLAIVAGERDNEWNVYGGRISERWSPRELRIGHLSSKEIGRLVDLLAKHSSLGLLEFVARDEQIAAFMEHANRQLLVALHEVTRGRPFEEIVFDEYCNITPERAQRLYLDICTLNQFGSPVRAGTIARASSIRFDDFKEKLFSPLEGVVLVTEDRYTNDVSYRARHAHVAEMVFREACQSDDQRVEQLQRLISALDIGYASDRQTFERIARGRSLGEILSSAESGRKIYANLLKHAPEDGFLFQQWAIFEMQVNGGSFDEAERLAEEAALRNPANKSIAHTQAEVARRAALIASSPIRRDRLRRLAKKRLAKAGHSSDKLVLSSRCKLLVDEVADLVDEIPEAVTDEQALGLSDKVKQAEDALRQGQQLYSEDADFLETEARFRKILGQHDRAFRTLERAWRAQPRGSGIAMRLSKLYESRGSASNARGVLEDALLRSPGDKGLHLDLARLILRTEVRPSTRVAEHLSHSYSKGDKNFGAKHFHAQYLFYVGKSTEALKLFTEVDKEAPAEFYVGSSSRQSIVAKLLGRYFGRVIKKDATYVFIQCSAYSENIYGNERLSDSESWQMLYSGADVEFSIEFSRKGPVARDIRKRPT